VGEPLYYYLLSALDPDFGQLFTVAADFAERLDRTPENERLYARLVARMISLDGLKAFDAAAVARSLEASARRAQDRAKLSLAMTPLHDLLREADYWAGRAGREVVTREDVEQAIDAAIERSDRLRDEVQERIRRGTVLIATEGTAVGQVNGLSVVLLDRFAFGHPVRITARARVGEGEVVDIMREVELAGPIHSKGVLTLSGFLAQRYAPQVPLSLAATLVFEQSYGGVEGDSASLAELVALLSAIGGVPVHQSLAVTGSVNQHGAVQAIGGVNEKIEGFFDLCAARGLSGRQAAVIPAANVDHLMLRREVVDAVAAGKFHVWTVETVDEALALLTGVPAGERDASGAYPEGTVNFLVEAGLAQMAALRIAFDKGKLDELGIEAT
jgi:lon-related putative ATP-dependent protease